jgi:glycosyltransferase involved in cell wall biosynthesis
VEAVLDRLKLHAYVDRVGQVSHSEALRELVHSDAALIIQSPDDSVHVPGKLFEALGARVPLLALSHPCEVTEIVKRTHAGLCAAHDPEAIAAALTQLRFRREPWAFNEVEREKFTANGAVSQLADLFDKSCRLQK